MAPAHTLEITLEWASQGRWVPLEDLPGVLIAALHRVEKLGSLANGLAPELIIRSLMLVPTSDQGMRLGGWCGDQWVGNRSFGSRGDREERE